MTRISIKQIGERIPVRLHLGMSKELTPTYNQIFNKITVKYYLSLDIEDVDSHRYHGKQEIELWRKDLL
jgi:vacuolar protein sorting-associated protein 26